MAERFEARIFRVSCQLDFCYGHRLLDYKGKCRHLHGHNGRIIVAIEASGLDERGMVFDFSEIKQALSRWIDQTLDHRMILRRDDPAVAALAGLGEPIYVMDTNPTAENLARLIFDEAARQGFPVAEVRLWETPTCFATYGRLDRPRAGPAHSRLRRARQRSTRPGGKHG